MRILLSAYACAPHRGSEPGVGWGWATALADAGHEVDVLTRWRPAIARELAVRPRPGLRFHHHELGATALRLRRLTGGAGVRAHYIAWQMTARTALRRLLAERRFDVAHHATFAQYWSPCALADLPLPFVWGPLGGGEIEPPGFWPGMGARAIGYEAARAALGLVTPALPYLRRTASSCLRAVAATPETADRLRRLGARDVVLCSQVALDSTQLATLGAFQRAPAPPLRLVALGDLLPHKGLHLAIAALARLRGAWRLDIVGDGPQRSRLERLAARLGLADRVAFLGALPQAAAWRILGAGHALLFPALHDSGGLAVAEAMAAGLPVVCLALGGPAGMVTPEVGFAVPAPTPLAAVDGIAAALQALLDDPRRLDELSRRARVHAARRFSWSAKIDAVYGGLPLARPVGGAGR